MQTSEIEAYAHDHRFHSTGTGTQARTLRVVWLTLFMMVVEIVAGWLYHSMALFADGCHMSTHAVALGIAWLAFFQARRHSSDHRYVFGTWKIEILGGYTSAILLGITGLAMAAISFERLLHPATIQFNQAIFVAIIGLLVNFVSLALLEEHPREHEHPHEHGHAREPAPGHAHAHRNLNLRAAYVHVAADALTSVLAIAALLGGKYLGWNWLDPVMGLVGAVLIVLWTRQLLSQTGGILLDREVDDTTRQAVRSAIESDGASFVSDLHVWRVAQGRYACIVSVVSAHPHPLAVYKQRLRALDQVVHATIEIERHAAQELPR